MHRLIVPGLFEPPDSGELPATPLLDHLVGRGELVRESPVGCEQLLAGAFGLDADDGEMPSGALLASYHGCGTTGQWACVAPVHLHVDRDRLLLFPVEPAAIDSDSVICLLNDHFRGEGVRFHATPEGPWLVELAASWMVETSSLDRVAGRSLDPFMPAGRDAGRLRSLMNECQMLLHADSLPGMPNSLWFWGFGKLPHIPRKPLGSFCKELLCNALMRSSNAGSRHGDDSLFVTGECLEGRNYGDMRRWLCGLSETEGRLRELLEKRGAELLLQSDNGLAVRYRSTMRFRFWQSQNFRKLIQSREPQA